MIRIVTTALLGVVFLSNANCALSQDSTLPKSSTDKEAVRMVTQNFETAFNSGKIDKIVDLFYDGAQIVDDAGGVHKGRTAITDVLTSFFKKFPHSTSKMTSDSIWLISPALAIDEGRRLVTTEDGKASAATRYTLVMIKHDGKWKIASAREVEDDALLTPHDRLEPLAWLVGDWVDEGSDAVVSINCKWAEDKNFLLVKFTAKVEGRPALKSSQRIGWDPMTHKIKSWVFDSDGGYGTGLWSQVDDRWVVKSTAVLPDGQTGAATLMLEPRDKDSYIMKGFDRFRGDEAEPDFEITIVRKPPAPGK
ncbi:MAG: SgcJ/EcaC family oxidoreductase [Pirellulales bacterium]|nr:SgcJ/EcaC family oxidoreductase [Pirellulales bacterium]